MPDKSDHTTMYATTPRIYRDQKAPSLQDRLSINALDFHEQIIDSSSNGGSEKTEGISKKRPTRHQRQTET
jgi:hypothetical protein